MKVTKISVWHYFTTDAFKQFFIHADIIAMKMCLQVLARDTLESSTILDGLQQKDYNFSIPVTRNMAPEAQIIAYFVQLDGEIVLDYEYITVNGLFENTVSAK